MLISLPINGNNYEQAVSSAKIASNLQTSKFIGNFFHNKFLGSLSKARSSALTTNIAKSILNLRARNKLHARIKNLPLLVLRCALMNCIFARKPLKFIYHGKRTSKSNDV